MCTNITLLLPDGQLQTIDLTGPLFAFCFQTNTREEWFNSQAFVLQSSSQNGNKAQAVFHLALDSDSVEACLTFWVEEMEVLSSIRLRHTGTSQIKAVKYPLVELYAATFDQLLISSAWGDCIQQPTKTIRDVSTSPSIRFDQDYIQYAPNEIIYIYPSIMAMQYMVLFNKASSRYLATYSQADETMTFHAKTVGKYQLQLSVNHYPFIKNESWTSPTCAQAQLGGGWHEAARVYRSHMAKAFPAPDVPAWMREAYHGWVEITQKNEKTPPKFPYTSLYDEYAKLRDQTGMEHLFLVGWHDNGHDTKFPRYLPNEQEGTPEQLRDALHQVRDSGGRCSLYTNARLIDIAEDFYQNQGGKNAVSLNSSGQEYHENYGTASTYAVSCPGCREYTEHMGEVARRICKDYGASGMFIDQISCNLDPFCYSTKHPHTKPSNNFLPGVEKELRTIRRAHKESNPDFHTFAEGCHERFSSLYDVNQGHGEEYSWQIGKSMPEQFLYTFPDRIVTGHCADKQQMYHAMAQLKPLDIKSSCFEDRSNWEPIQTYIALRKQYKAYFLQGTFIDDEGFSYQQGVRVFAVRAEDQSLCFCVWVQGAVEETACWASVRLPKEYTPHKAIYPSQVSMEKDGAWIKLAWTGPLCYILAGK